MRALAQLRRTAALRRHRSSQADAVFWNDEWRRLGLKAQRAPEGATLDRLGFVQLGFGVDQHGMPPLLAKLHQLIDIRTAHECLTREKRHQGEGSIRQKGCHAWVSAPDI